MADLKVALEELKEESDSGRLEAPAIPLRKHEWRWQLASAGIAVLAIAMGVAWWLRNPQRTTTSTQTHLRQITHDVADTGFPALSPDGKLLAYQSDRAQPGKYDIWVEQTAGGPAIRLTQDGTNYSPWFSADGSKICFESFSKGVCLVSALGGESRLLAAGGRSPSVSPDGRSVAYFSFEGQFYIVPAEGGQPRSIATGYSRTFPRESTPPMWSPDSQLIAFRGRKSAEPETDEWWAAPVDGGTPVRTGWLHWSADRHATDGGAKRLAFGRHIDLLANHRG